MWKRTFRKHAQSDDGADVAEEDLEKGDAEEVEPVIPEKKSKLRRIENRLKDHFRDDEDSSSSSTSSSRNSSSSSTDSSVSGHHQGKHIKDKFKDPLKIIFNDDTKPADRERSFELSLELQSYEYVGTSPDSFFFTFKLVGIGKQPYQGYQKCAGMCVCMSI